VFLKVRFAPKKSLYPLAKWKRLQKIRHEIFLLDFNSGPHSFESPNHGLVRNADLPGNCGKINIKISLGLFESILAGF
jgi:hypothetical protein